MSIAVLPVSDLAVSATPAAPRESGSFPAELSSTSEVDDSISTARRQQPSEMSDKLRAAIIVVSETASKDPSTDKCIPALQDVFAQDGGDRWATPRTKIVSDNVLDIQRVVTSFTDGEEIANLIVTSGGTGFAQKDVTPEVSPSAADHWHCNNRPADKYECPLTY